MPIKITTHPDRNLTLLEGQGVLGIQEILEAIEVFYQGGPTRNVLWDIREADLSPLTPEDTIRAKEVLAPRAEARIGGKIAVVATDSLAFGISRMFEGHLHSLPQDFMVFRVMEEAEDWLEV